MQISMWRRLFAVFLVGLLVIAGAIAPSMSVAQDATPASVNVPEGALGEQMQWLVDYINMPADEAATVDLTTIFSPGVLADVPADQLAAIMATLREQLAPVTIDTESIVTTEDLPPTNANFILVGRDGTQQPVSLTVSPVSGWISAIWFSTQLASAPTSEATATQAPTETTTAAPTETATAIPTQTATELPSNTPTSVPTETSTTAPTETATQLPTETPTAVPTETATAAPTETATPAPTETATEIPTETATATEVPTETPTPAPTETATQVPTETPTPAPTETPTTIPTETPTAVPTETPTDIPTETATAAPTETPTAVPTEASTEAPTETATEIPTGTSTAVPTETPTELPTGTATSIPTETSTVAPTETATAVATEVPTQAATEEATDTGSPIASPEAGSPVASPEAAFFPDNALGEQAAWTWSTLNTDGKPVAPSEIEAHVAPELLEISSAEEIAAGLVELQQAYGPFTFDPDSIVMTMDEPPTNMRYGITGADGTRFDVSLSIDRDTELLTGYLISLATPVASPVAAALPSGIVDTEVSFTSGDDTLYGSVMAPEDFSPVGASAAALIISGSGPTDRDSNSGGLPLGTTRNLAITLAQDGIPSLRYDKIGSGQSGLGSHVDPTTIDYELYLQEARDAVDFLSEQPGVDPSKLILVGHSEGALFALVLADELTKAGTPPAGLILVAPLSIRYLDLIEEQLSTQLKAAVDGGQMPEDAANTVSAELTSIVETLRTTGELPATIESPELAQLFNPGTAAFLAQIDQIDPSELAAGLPTDLPVLVLLGNKDTQVTGDQVRQLLGGFRAGGNTELKFVALPKADHTLRIVEGEANPAVDYANPDLEFSPDAVTAIDDFLAAHGLSSSGA